MVRSKRKSSDPEPKGKAKKRKESGDDGVLHDPSVFGELVTKAGFILKKEDKSNQLKCDQIVFQQELTKAIKHHANFPQVVEEFTEALSKHLEIPKRFFKALMPTLTAANCDTSTRCGGQDSLLRLLIGIDQLQPSIMSMLLEKLAEFTGDEEPILDDNDQVNMPRLIMNQFRWLNNIVNSKEVTEKMLEIVCIVSPDAQREIITCIPEVVDDSEHNTVAKELKDLLVENNQLAVAILDALSNLCLKPDLLSEVRGSVISSLPSVALDDLPVIVRFLLQTVSPADALQVMTELRRHLDFHTSLPPTSCSTPNGPARDRHPSNPSTIRGSEALTLDALKSGIRFQRSLAEAWVKAIEGLKSAGDHKIVDIFVILILHQCGHKKAIESLVRNKVRAGHFTEVLLHATFGAHTQVLREYFPAVLALAEVLLRSPEPSISQFAAAMYKHAFVAFDTYCQQEIVGSLVTHIGSGFASEVDVSLDILADLVENHTTKMGPFSIFVKGVLDYLDNLAVGQIRKLYGMLSTLAFKSAQGEGQIQDEMFIVIRKQLSNNDIRYKKMGVIGAIMVVQSLASSMDQSVIASQSSADLPFLPEDAYKQVINLLHLVRSSTNSCPEAAALFMDELASVVARGNIDKKVEEWISEHVIGDFQDDYVIDVDPDSPLPTQEAVLPMDMQFGLDDQSEGAIAINLLPLVTKSLTKTSLVKNEKQVSPLCLASHFRLVQTCERRQHDSLEDIDALLGCPLNLAKVEVADKLDSLSVKEKQALCHTYFYTINWFREVVNAFATQTDTEMKAKVIIRLKNITDVQTLLQKYLSACPSYSPPAAVFDSQETGTVTPGGAAGTSGGKRGRKPGKGKKKDKGKESLDETDINNTTVDKSQLETQAEKENVKDSEPAPVNLSAYRVHLREFDMDVFTILNTGLITRAALDTEMNTKDTTPIQLEPLQLELLLDDLFHKLDHILIASATKRRTFLKTKSDRNCGFSHLDQLGPLVVAQRAVKLLPALCQHLEATSAFFQALITENDGLLDGPGSNTPEAQQMATCFHLLIQILATIFAWNGFLSPEHRDLLKEGLTTIATRINTSAPSQPSFNDLLKQSFQYVENFSGSVPSLAAGVTLTRLLTSLADRTDSQTLHSKISALAEKFLKRDWTGPDGEKLKGARHNEHIQHMLRMMLTHSDDVLGVLENIATVGMAELLQADKNGSSETYPTLTKNSFAIYLRVLLTTLVVTIKDITPGRENDATELKVDRLLRWSLAVSIFHVLVNLIKAFDARSNLITILKNGRQFVEIFLRLGMPLLDHTFRHHRGDVQGLLKNVQLSTRVLHHMAGHSKIVRDVCLTNLVPPLKKVLEMFVYRVKAMLTLNRCLEAFWLGNLKNRDLKGEEILTQTTADSAQDSESDRESLPEDDDDSEVEVQTNAANDEPRSDSEDGSYSETY